MASPSLDRLSLDDFRSPADRKSYRLLTLPNGLDVLLIQSDAGSKAQVNSTDSEDGNTRDSLSSTEEADVDNEDNEGEEEANPPQAAVGLTVNVGSLSDPETLPGLAHYLEHMVFMGSEEYPAEDAFEVFLSAHGGSSNGATECESTRFVFDVDAGYLEPALDMFASLFTAPLLRPEAMGRELKAVESEFQRVRNNNPVRVQQVMCETSVQGHSYTRCFTWGNAESLKLSPERDGVDVRAQMVEFFDVHYVAPAMKLCVYGCESLDVLEQYVTQSFSAIPRSRTAGSYEVSKPVEQLSVPYGSGAGQRPSILRVVPEGEKRSMRLYWMLPAMMEKYQQKPWYYVGHLLGHEGPDSTASVLKRLKWATDLISGTSDRDGYEFGSFGTVFEVRVALTEDGLACWEQVVQVVFDALHLFSAKAADGSLPDWVFEELRSSSEMDFRFQEDAKAPVTVCRELSERMLPRHRVLQTCPGDLLRYDLIQGEFDTSSVSAFLGRLSAENLRVVLLAPSAGILNSDECQTERWFGTKYTVNQISDAVIAAWSQNSGKFTGVSPLPEPNPFMPRDFSVLPCEPATQHESDVPPDLILTTSTTQLWYKRDHKFLVPKASVSFFVTIPASTAVNHMLAELHVELVRHRLQHTLEQAGAASFEVELDVRDEAIEVVIAGFSDSLLALVRSIMQEVLRPAEASEVLSELTLARVELEREYRNATLSPRVKAYELRLQMLESRAVSTDDKLEALQSREGREKELAADLAHFVAAVLGRSEGLPSTRCLVIGNMTREAAVTLVLAVEAFSSERPACFPSCEPEMELEPDAPLLAPRCHTIALPATTNGLLLRRHSERVGERNSVVEVYFQIGKVGPEDRAYAVLLRALLAQPLFHELRTKQQLGYSVACSIRDTHDVLGLCVSVQSASHAAGAVATKLDTFLHEDFPHDYLLSDKQLSPKRFAAHVQTLQRTYSRPDSTLTEQSERYWEEIVSGRLAFDLDVQIAKAIGDCTRHGLLLRYQCWLQGSTSCCKACTSNFQADRMALHRTSKSHGPRKLRVHVVGKCSPFKPLEQLVPPDKTPVIISGDLHDFKRELQCHCHIEKERD